MTKLSIDQIPSVFCRSSIPPKIRFVSLTSDHHHRHYSQSQISVRSGPALPDANQHHMALQTLYTAQNPTPEFPPPLHTAFISLPGGHMCKDFTPHTPCFPPRKRRSPDATETKANNTASLHLGGKQTTLSEESAIRNNRQPSREKASKKIDFCFPPAAQKKSPSPTTTIQSYPPPQNEGWGVGWGGKSKNMTPEGGDFQGVSTIMLPSTPNQPPRQKLAL